MTMAESAVQQQPRPSGSSSPVARVKTFGTMAEAEPVWRALESLRPLSTPYQQFDFLDVWARHLGAADGLEPLIAVGFDAQDKPAVVLPFGRRRKFGLTALEFLGGKHSNFNMAVWRRDVAATVTAEHLRDMFTQLRAHADALLLANQCMSWQGAPNPFSQLPHQLSPSMGHSGALESDFEALLRARTKGSARKKMRWKEQTLAKHGAIVFRNASDPAEAHHFLSVFFEQKSARMRMLGQPDIFADPNVRAFVEDSVARRRADGSPVLEISALVVGDTVVATSGGLVLGDRYSALFNSIIPDQFGPTSPGEQMQIHLVRDCCQRGLKTYDLGVGEARYKETFCGDVEVLFDAQIALTDRGHALVAIERARTAVKRTVKQTPALWSAYCQARKLRGMFAGAR